MPGEASGERVASQAEFAGIRADDVVGRVVDQQVDDRKGTGLKVQSCIMVKG